MARYLYHNRDHFEGKIVLDLGSGTGIGALSLLKFSRAAKVVLTDYTEDLITLLDENVRL